MKIAKLVDAALFSSPGRQGRDLPEDTSESVGLMLAGGKVIPVQSLSFASGFPTQNRSGKGFRCNRLEPFLWGCCLLSFSSSYGCLLRLTCFSRDGGI
jgi:hypothetical protein